MTTACSCSVTESLFFWSSRRNYPMELGGVLSNRYLGYRQPELCSTPWFCTHPEHLHDGYSGISRQKTCMEKQTLEKHWAFWASTKEMGLCRICCPGYLSFLCSEGIDIPFLKEAVFSPKNRGCLFFATKQRYNFQVWVAGIRDEAEKEGNL